MIRIKKSNTILYCRKWKETIDFYENKLRLPVTLAKDWFKELKLSDSTYISIADDQKASIKSSRGMGLTISLCVDSADEAWESIHRAGIEAAPPHDHPWGSRTFFIFDPEGNRIEIWSKD